MSQRFFGHPESPLFGVYHAPRGIETSPRAVVICPPVGQEYIRAHWQLRMMAAQLARRGVHVFRFDYHGIGDSAGRIEQVDSLDIWTRNIEQAIEHLTDASGAGSVMLLGQRMGGALAGIAARTRVDVNSVVLWESVFDGRSYVDSLRKMHAEMLDLWVCKMTTPNDQDFEEILGSRYQRSLIHEIESLEFSPESIPQPQLIIESPLSERSFTHAEPTVQKVIQAQRDGAWNDLREIESAFLRPAMAGTIVKTVLNMFERLNRFDVLQPEPITGAN